MRTTTQNGKPLRKNPKGQKNPEAHAVWILRKKLRNQGK